ncbi:hypothetical protein LOC68_22670 [Blastopirellula sp. JC732]|uniref:Uncharacterized protein n=1 Tax=Blastopirellula sediminis TaxID=2894196 RepID=A0A9X1MQU5_9BACT|nr:hypothetical protein [Blastopirellula sediminis]MCC9605494.1 hypothetical protein [Blastopirellula sediminis]MCC9631206.1 hypothetical protein [Blastopirellula sediminis]
MPNPTESPSDKPPQFDLGCLLAVIAIFAGIFTLIAPFVVDFNRNHWLIIGAVSGGFCLGIAAGVLIAYYPRYVARNRSGDLLLELPPNNAAGGVVWETAVGVGCEGVITLLFGVPISLIAFLFQTPTYEKFPLQFSHLLPIAGVAAAMAAIGIIVTAPKLRPQLRQKGLLVELKLTPWEKLTTARWSSLKPDVLRIGSYGVEELAVPPEDRERVEAILREYCPNLFSADEAAAVD